MRRKLPLIIGVVLSLVAVYLIKVYTDQQRQVIIEDARKSIERIRTEQVPVLVATRDIPKGSTIDNNSVGVAVIPMQHVQPQAATSLDRIAGMVTLVQISKGEQITLNKLMSKKVATGSNSLSMLTPIGKRAITISVDQISAVGGMVRPGDYVDLVSMINVPVTTAEGKQASQATIVPLFQNVLVLAIGQETAVMEEAVDEGRYAPKREARSSSSPAITLALSPQEANLLAFVQEQGKIRLALRSPADAEVEPLQSASWDTLLQYLMPQKTVETEPEEEEIEEEPKEYIEIYRGLTKEKIPLSD